jgi:hypothetical protein
MLWYKLNGTWQTWDYLHNTLGYSESATYAVSYKQASQANWGQVYTGDGYHDGSQSDYTDGLFWADGKVGWYDLNDLAEICELYPSDAIVGPTFTNDEQSSNSVFVRDSYQDEYYLIQKALELGWVTVEEAADAGWNITEQEKTPICGVLTATSDEVVEVETPYQLENGTISFTGELRDNVVPSSGRVDNGTISFTGELRESIIPESGVVDPRPEPGPSNVLEMDFGFRYWDDDVWLNINFPDTPQIQSISQSDTDSLSSFGVDMRYSSSWGSTYKSPYGWPDSTSNNSTNFTWELLCLYQSIESGQGAGQISAPSDATLHFRGFPSVEGLYLNTAQTVTAKGCRIKITKLE